MKNKNYKAFIFDFFGVISSEVAPVWFRKYFSEKDIAELRKKYVEPIDSGDTTENHFFEILSKMVAVPPETIRREWLTIATIRPNMVKLIKELAGRYKLAILSDAPSPFFREIIAANKLENLFDEIVVSSEIHMTKADIQAYELVLRKLGMLPKETIFIDDNPLNVERARSIGIEAIVFNGQPALEKSLFDLGILTK